MGCDLQRLANSSQFTGFNPRTRMRCDRIWRISRLKSSMFQSTHPHGVRHTKQINLWCVIDVSIHAPARGATLADLAVRQRGQVSIHAPARGATVHRLCNSHRMSVSIHAPARGATVHRLCNSHRMSVSIHAPARGATVPRRPEVERV